jgi:uncharacterized protein
MRIMIALASIGASILACRSPVAAAIVLTNVSSTYFQDFDGLANTNTNNSVLPDGWFIHETGGDGLYAAGTGSSTTGGVYSFGSTGSTERALGGLRTATVLPLFGVQLQIQGSTQLLSLDIAYRGEQWRLGATNRLAADRLDFQFSTDATTLLNGTWTDFDTLDFHSPITNSTAGLLNGNLPANSQDLATTLGGFTFNTGQVWFRWSDFDVSGADDGLAIDNFSVTANFAPAAAVPEPSSLLLLGTAGLAAGRWIRRRRFAAGSTPPHAPR